MEKKTYKIDEALKNKMSEEYMSVQIPSNLKERMIEEMERAKKEKRREKKVRYLKGIGMSVAAVFAGVVILSNTNYGISQALAKVPVIGNLSKIVTFRTYETKQDGFQAHIEVPQVEKKEGELTLGELELNKKMEEYANSFIEQFETDLKENDGIAKEAIDSTYEVIRDNDRMLSIRINTVITSGGAAQKTKVFHMDKKTGELIELKDLFKEGTDYISVISENIKEQMRAEMKEDSETIYFLDTDMEESNFTAISEAQSFYFDEKDNLVIAFDEYEVAPGYMGTVEFTIDSECLKDILL